jgi:hypothetical protein
MLFPDQQLECPHVVHVRLQEEEQDLIRINWEISLIGMAEGNLKQPRMVVLFQIKANIAVGFID